jgi:hypothetical protein
MRTYTISQTLRVLMDHELPSHHMSEAHTPVCPSKLKSTPLSPCVQHIVQVALTSQYTSIETRKSMVKQLLSQVIIECLLAAIVGVCPFPGTPVRLVEAKWHGLALCCAIRAGLCRASFWRVNKGLVPLHTDEWLCAAAELWNVQATISNTVSSPRGE